MKQIYFTLTALILTATALAGTVSVTNGRDAGSNREATDSLHQASFEWFYVDQQSADIQLTWAISKHLNSSHFEIQRSIDRQSWKTIALVLASQTSNLVKQYNYTDNSNEEVVYYRIRQVDTNGRAHYSSIRTFRNKKELYRVAKLETSNQSSRG